MTNENTENTKSYKKAKDIVFRLFKYRIRSSFEIVSKLEEKGFEQEIIKEVINYFSDLTLIDDHVFAQKWIESRLRRPYGSNRIKQELKQKGLPKDIIETEIVKALHNDDYKEIDIVRKLVRKRIEKYRGIDKTKIKQRVYGYLQRRGFSFEAITKVIRELI